MTDYTRKLFHKNFVWLLTFQMIIISAFFVGVTTNI